MSLQEKNMEHIAHIRTNKNGMTEYQSCEDHCMNVAKLCYDMGKPFHLENTCWLLGILHDSGKFVKKFTNYIQASFQGQKLAKFDHSTAGGKVLYDQLWKQSDIGKLLVEICGMAIISHHSGLQNFVNIDGDESDFLRRLTSPLDGYTEAREEFLKSFSIAEITYHLNLAKQEIEYLEAKLQSVTDDNKYNFFLGMVHKLVFSILIDADRLDTASFMVGKSLRPHWEIEKLWQNFSEKLEAYIQQFSVPQNEKMKKINDARSQISLDCLHFANHQPGIYTLSVPTGSGKTLASMRFALAHAKKYKKKRIFVIIPYTSIIDQNAKEIEDIFKTPEAVLEFHSNIMNEEEHSDTQEDSYTEKAELKKSLTERWDVPVIFTTQVQFLNTLFSRSRYMRRLHCLCDSVIIFDEIQTLPRKCTALFNQAINFLSWFGKSTMVLCTATQPNLDNLKIPLDVTRPKEMVSNLTGVFQAFRRVNIENHCIPGGWTVEAMAADIWTDAENLGSVLCIVNKTKTARALYEEIKRQQSEELQKVEIMHLSTKMCPAHRKQALDNMRKHLQNKDKKVICISTALIEAGIDISFPIVYRLLAGLPSIAQAAGRCNRHGELPLGFVKIYNMDEGSFAFLPDIALGQRITMELLHLPRYKEHPESILNPAAIKAYFSRYTQEQMDMQYPICNNKDTLYNLLSTHILASDTSLPKGSDELGSFQAFKDACREFYVIDSHTISVLTPFGKGKDFILYFNSSLDSKEGFYKQLKQAQQYMVNVFSYEEKILEQAGCLHSTDMGIIYLADKQYSDETGVVFEEQKNEFCIT